MNRISVKESRTQKHRDTGHIKNRTFTTPAAEAGVDLDNG